VLARIIEQGSAYQEEILAEVEQQRLIDLPGSHLRMETSEDRLLVMDFLYDVGRGGMDIETWFRLNPEKGKRIWEICPKKVRREE
jgi:hypothetical protein